ncbi:hypothetical protein [Kitasatospora sp. NPDC002965]|uniref:hypothetical protein n=1 Tax=Kitasatospora sp. NPDC002965 TaxID=3154775 RepID=UPI0033BDC881
MSEADENRAAPALPEPPVGTAAPAGLDDAALAAELQALDDYQRGHAGRPGIGLVIMGRIGPRRGALTREQTRRELARRDAAKAAAERERLRARQDRTSIGRRDKDGRYPVAVDGRERGRVWRGARDWWHEVDGGDRSGPSDTRWEAADAIVVTVDARAAAATQQRRREEPPEGWVAAAEGEELQRLDVVRLAGTGHGPAWSRPWRVCGREEHRDGRVSYQLEPAEADRPHEGYVLFAEPLRRFVRPSAAVLAALPAVPFRVLYPEECSERRLLNVSDELSSLSRVAGCAEASGRALGLLAEVEAGRSKDPAAAMREITGLAEELLRIVTDPQGPNWESRRYDRGNAEHAARWATWAAQRFEEGAGALTEEYRGRPHG